MSARLVVAEVDKDAYTPLLALEKYVHSGQLGEELIALVKVRASQLNGCAFCLDTHATEGRKAGLDQRKLVSGAAQQPGSDPGVARRRAVPARWRGALGPPRRTLHRPRGTPSRRSGQPRSPGAGWL